MEGGQLARPAQDRHGKTQRIPTSDKCGTIRAMRMRRSEGVGRALPLSVQAMNSPPDRDVAVCNHEQRKPFLLPGGEVALGRRELETKHGSRAGNNTICNSYRATRRKPTADKPEHLTPYSTTHHLVPPTAGAASAAEDRMLNTWRIAFKLAYQLTNPRESQETVQMIGQYSGQVLCMGFCEIMSYSQEGIM